MDDSGMIEELERLVTFLESEARQARTARRFEAASRYFRGAQTVAGIIRKLRRRMESVR